MSLSPIVIHRCFSSGLALLLVPGWLGIFLQVIRLFGELALQRKDLPFLFLVLLFELVDLFMEEIECSFDILILLEDVLFERNDDSARGLAALA